MSLQFFLSDLPEHNNISNGSMSHNSGWRIFGFHSIRCWQTSNINGAGLCWYVCKDEASRGFTSGVRSDAFKLTAGQKYDLIVWVYLAGDTTELPQARVYLDIYTVMVQGGDYTPAANGWLQLKLTFTATMNAPEAFMALIYERETMGEFYFNNVVLASAADEITEVEIMPDWSLDLGQTASVTKTRSQSGRLFLYDWYHYTQKSIALDFVPAAQAEIINGFWRKRTKIQLTVLNDGAIMDYTVGVLTDNKTPLNQYRQPYTNYYRGKLTLEEHKTYMSFARDKPDAVRGRKDHLETIRSRQQL